MSSNMLYGEIFRRARSIRHNLYEHLPSKVLHLVGQRLQGLLQDEVLQEFSLNGHNMRFDDLRMC